MYIIVKGYDKCAAKAAEANEYEKSMSEANIMLTNMIREATGWDI